jgi:hypothetical protein
LKKELSIKGSSAHRQQTAKVEEGYLLINQNWFFKKHQHVCLLDCF